MTADKGNKWFIIWVERKPSEISASREEKLEKGRGWKTANHRCSRHKYIKLIAR